MSNRFNPQSLPTKLDTMTENIRQILLDTPSARSNDKILILTFWRRHGPLVYDQASGKLQFRERDGITYQDFLRIPSTESICRLKRMIQALAKNRIKAGIGTEQDAECLPSERVAEQRVILETVNKHFYYRD